ncbi:hypothetical protein M9H77_35317 [Catharanthus roseus]|uniref:Uncharacterized protein n=1 Tax=Catharanthus roseus TaxID=4058 RepID=A0ACB9ZNN4_CATRO|nr:hypothetical protein M9H77_35317 [Catharanthus roseus]
MKLDAEKWTRLHDGGHRHGIITTNISEALNSVLKKARVLPLKAMVELIFNKLVNYFYQHREEAENFTTYNLREGIYMIKSPIRVSGTGNNVYTLRLNNKFCICQKWQTYTLPCSHVLAVCRKNRSRTDAYIPEIYLRQTYRKIYQANFYPVFSENFWRDVPLNLTFYPPNIKKERGRKQGKRFQGEMDCRNPNSPPRCGRKKLQKAEKEEGGLSITNDSLRSSPFQKCAGVTVRGTNETREVSNQTAKRKPEERVSSGFRS